MPKQVASSLLRGSALCAAAKTATGLNIPFFFSALYRGARRSAPGLPPAANSNFFTVKTKLCYIRIKIFHENLHTVSRHLPALPNCRMILRDRYQEKQMIQ
jgi:hypothetical protein